MKDRLLRAGSMAAAAVAIGGALILIMPQHAGNIAGLVIITGGVAVALYALAANIPEWTEAGWLASPFNRQGASDEPRVFEEADRIRRRLTGRRQRVEGAPALTPESIRLLQSLIRATLDREGLDPTDHDRLTPLTRAVLVAKPIERRSWLATRRPAPERVADVVHRILDDLNSPEHGVPR